MTKEQKRDYLRVWRSKNREKSNAYGRKTRLNHLERYRAKDRARDKIRVRDRNTPQRKEYNLKYRAKNREKLIAQGRHIYYRDREKILQWKRDHPPAKEHKRTYNREWCRKNPGKARTHHIDRKMRMKTSPEESEAINQFMIRIKSMEKVHCNYCGKPVPGKKIHFDHVIPLSRGGKHTLFNLCASCQPCNNHKYNKLPHEFSMKGQTFLPV